MCASVQKARDAAAKACQAIFSEDFLRTMMEPVRIEIFCHLVRFGRADIGTVAKSMPQDRSVIARHLSMMAKAGVLQAEPEGRHTFYQIDGEHLLNRIQAIASLVTTLAPLCCPPKS